MDCYQAIVGQHEDDHFEQVAGAVWSDGQLLRWVGVSIEVDHDERMICGVTDGIVVDAVAPGGRVDLDTLLV
jgi:hypothetical protein